MYNLAGRFSSNPIAAPTAIPFWPRNIAILARDCCHFARPASQTKPKMRHFERKESG